MSAQTAIDYLATQHRDLTIRDAEPAWLREMRRLALERVAAGGLPTTRNENWKYTNLRLLGRRRFAPDARADVDAAALPALGDTGLAAMTFVNGRLHEQRQAEGVTMRRLATVLADEPGYLAERLGRLVDDELHPLAALNTAFFADGVLIEIDRDAEIDVPLLIEHVSAPAGTPALISPRLLIRMQPNSRLRLIERFIGLADAANYTNSVTEIELEAGAAIEHYRVQELNDAEFATNLIQVEQAADSALTARCVDLGGKLVRNDLHTRLTAPGAAARLSGFYLAVGRQHVDNHTRIDHLAPHTVSDEDYRGVLADNARAVFNGKVLVARDAQKVDARQSNRNLLLSGKAEIDTKPELEIYADDVKCSHGATVGQLDPEALFYLRSRGIGERTARALLTFGFVEAVLAGFDIPALRDYVDDIVTRRLPGHERLETLV